MRVSRPWSTLPAAGRATIVTLWDINQLVLGLAALAAFCVVIEVGFKLGLRYRAGSDEATRAHVGALQAALLGLLALLLGFTFAMAVSRFDARKSLVLEEANAIGTTYLRARLLPAPQRQEAQGLLKEYLGARLAFYEAGLDERRLGEARTASARLQERLWSLAAALAEQDPHSVAMGLFAHSLNEVIDVNEKRLTALNNHVPETVLHLLFAVAAVALGFVGYGAGLNGQRRYVSTVFVGALIALVLAAILDVDRPRRGFIKVSQESLVRLKQVLETSQP